MKGSRISGFAAALADPTRAEAVAALLSGTAHTSGELARVCGVAPSTMSSHLSKLIDAGVVQVESAGRYRAYRIASRELADLLERMDGIDLPETEAPKRPAPGRDISYARSCYDHVAGRLGVELHDSCLANGWITRTDDTAELTDSGRVFFEEHVDIDMEALRAKRRPMLRIDLDWTERRAHLAGSLPAALMTHMLDERWLTRRESNKRILRVTEQGRVEIERLFGVSDADLANR